MTHVQTIPAKTYHFEHHRFFGRRIGSPSDVGTSDEMLRNWGLLYQAFESAEDAKALTRAIGGKDCNLILKGELVDRFFWDDKTQFIDPCDALEGMNLTAEQQAEVDKIRSAAGSPAYVQTDARVVAALAWYLTSNPTQAELDKTENMEHVRKVMAGVTLFPGAPFEFVVTELPAERASE